MWAEQLVPLLGAGYRVLRLDMRGHGGSAPVDGDYTMDALAAEAFALVVTIDKTLVTRNGSIVSVWGSTHRKS